MSNELRNIPIIVLCGGLGTRLRSVFVDLPKILASMGDKTLLDMIMTMLTKAGFEKIILSVGYLKEQVKAHCEERGYRVVFSEEDEPLGTGGAVKRALHFTNGAERFFIMNGDMVFSPDFNALCAFHNEKEGILSMALTKSYRGDSGNIVEMDETQRVTGWRKKTDADANGTFHLNAGIYIVNRKIAKLFPDKSAFSLEDEFFPTLFRRHCYGFRTDEILIDIGVPERYRIARKMYPVVM
ncbi:MAG: nucleotidyl transferase [Parcubacteria group bacterium Gr01-1014_17]|nr:MAG: nucleotidyl transferase [Parcubacteria group bacterium Gr01-1014_17]